MKKFLIAIASIFLLANCNSNAQESVPATKMTQNQMQEKLNPLFQKLQAIPEDGNEEAAVKAAALDFVKENKNEAGVYVVRALLAQVMPADELIKLIDSDEYFSKDSTLMKEKANLLVQAETAEGKKFKDFEAEYNGKVTKLSDYVGKGKYVLVDFWASWCGPCKAEIPNLIKVYNTYKGDKFEVLGVATWDKPEDTVKSIEKLGIPYPQIMNAQQAGSDAYGITGIPQIILFSPDGTILKRNLRGEAIEKAIKELIK